MLIPFTLSNLHHFGDNNLFIFTDTFIFYNDNDNSSLPSDELNKKTVMTSTTIIISLPQLFSVMSLVVEQARKVAER